MNLRKEQIEKVFINYDKLKTHGIWFSGIEGEGEFNTWWENGQLRNQIFYANGSINGDLKLWDESGKLTRHEVFKNDEIVKVIVDKYIKK